MVGLVLNLQANVRRPLLDGTGQGEPHTQSHFSAVFLFITSGEICTVK